MKEQWYEKKIGDWFLFFLMAIGGALFLVAGLVQSCYYFFPETIPINQNTRGYMIVTIPTVRAFSPDLIFMLVVLGILMCLSALLDFSPSRSSR